MLETDSWKEELLKQLENDATCVCYHNSKDKYKVFGLPFYNHEQRSTEFEDEFDRITR